MKFSALGLKGYKAFSGKSEFSIKPITLVYGYNNAGKSSLLRALPLLADSIDPNMLNTLDTNCAALKGGTLFDILSRGDTVSSLSFILTFDEGELSISIEPVNSGKESSLLELGWSPSIGEGFTLTRKAGAAPVWPCSQVKFTLEGMGRSNSTEVELYRSGVVPDIVPDSTLPTGFVSTYAKIQSAMRELKRSVQWIGALRRSPDRRIKYSVPELQVGQFGENAAMLLAYDSLRPEGERVIFDLVKEWYLEASGFSLNIKPQGAFFDLKLINEKSEVDFIDAGEGISQVFPVLVAAGVVKSKLLPAAPVIAIEQPELHLQPKLHENLANVFVDAIGGEARFLVETHSPHLLYSFLLAIAEGRLHKDDFVVYWIESSESGVIPIEVKYDSKAMPIGERIPEQAFFEQDELALRVIDAQRSAT